MMHALIYCDFFVQSLGVLFLEISIAVLQQKFAGSLDFLEKILNEGPVKVTVRFGKKLPRQTRKLAKRVGISLLRYKYLNFEG